MTYQELSAARRETNDQLGDLYTRAADRELTPEEAAEERTLTRSLRQINEQMSSLSRDREYQNAAAQDRRANMPARFREFLQAVRKVNSATEREILLAPGLNSNGTANTDGNIEAAGAVRLTLHDVLPTLREGLDLPEGLHIVTGVSGNEIYPVSLNDVEMEEVGEVEALTDQVLDFASITPTVRRAGITVPVSNMAIDNAAFDLMGFVQRKFGVAFREYWAKKIYSRAEWKGNKGAFSGLAPEGVIDIASGQAYKLILLAVARFLNKGYFEGEVCLTMDRVTEAELKATPKVEGSGGGFIIENGRCAGYPYTTSHYVNTEFNAEGKLVAGKGRYLLIGVYDWLAAQQHGDVRLTIDATSQGVAKRNITAITLNTAFSMTDLSAYTAGANGKTQAFACYLIVDGEEKVVVASQHAVKIAKGETKTISAATNIAGAKITYAVTKTLSGVSVSPQGVITAGTTAGTAEITVTATAGEETATDVVTVEVV